MAKDLKKAAADCLSFNKHFDKVYVTADGICFQHKNDAVNYAIRQTDKTLTVFERDGDVSTETEDNQDPTALNVADTKKLIEGTESEEALALLMEGEKRPMVKAAASKQLAILRQKALDEQSAAADEANAKRNAEVPQDAPDTEGLGDGVKTETETKLVIVKAEPVAEKAPEKSVSTPKAKAAPKAKTAPKDKAVTTTSEA